MPRSCEGTRDAERRSRVGIIRAVAQKEATGELLEIERLTSSLERGHGKRPRWQLAGGSILYCFPVRYESWNETYWREAARTLPRLQSVHRSYRSRPAGVSSISPA